MLSTRPIYLNIDTLFFRYESLCMSLYGVVADYSWSGFIKKHSSSINLIIPEVLQ